jgi:uncharacterized lipoprotein YehR (DUF1307 family)
MARYKVSFSGFAYVEADDKEEAKDMFQDDEEMYKETDIDNVEEVDECQVIW